MLHSPLCTDADWQHHKTHTIWVIWKFVTQLPKISKSRRKKDGRVAMHHHHFYKLRNIHENGYGDYNEAQGAIIVNSAHWTQWPKITAKKKSRKKKLFRFDSQTHSIIYDKLLVVCIRFWSQICISKGRNSWFGT